EIGERTRPGKAPLAAPCVRRSRIAHVVLYIAAVEGDDLAELPRLDDLASDLHHRIADVIESDGVAHTAALCSFCERNRLREIQRERLLAGDVCACDEGCERHLGVEVVRRADIDEVDVRIGDELAPVSGASGETK